MRLIRLGDQTSLIGADVRSALSSWGRGDSIAGGIALLGCQPPGCARPVDAVVVLPRGILVVVGVDLPDPAVRLDAPMAGQWKTDGWPLVRKDGAVNPATEAVEAAGAVSARLQEARVEPVPVGTVVAVGPYVSQVFQPTSDLLRGVRILHPEPMTLLNAAKELATYERRLTVSQARQVIAALAPDVSADGLDGEGFTDQATPTLAAEHTALIPKFTDPPPGATQPPTSRDGVNWLPIVAAILIAVLLIAGIVVAISSSGSDDGSSGDRPSGTRQNAIPINGVAFSPKGSVQETECAKRAFGAVQTWLTQHGCARLIRARFEATVNGRSVAVLVAVLRFSDTASASELRAVADRPGGGGIADQAVDGVAWPSDPKPTFDSAAYLSGREGNSVKLVQAVWLGEPSNPQDQDLRGVADRALNLTVTG